MTAGFLGAEDWLEAFRSHPKIGEKKSEQAQSARLARGRNQEQAGTRDSAMETMAALAAATASTRPDFGYIFIVCATGKTSAEMLAILRERLTNDPEHELPSPLKSSERLRS